MRPSIPPVNRLARPPSGPRARTREGDNLLGAALMVGSMAAFAANDAAIKYVTQTLPLSQAVALRGAAVTLMLWFVARRHGGVIWWPSARGDRRMLGMRTVAEVGSTLLYLVALQHMPLGQLSAILQSLPLLVMLAAAVVFRERLGWQRLLAVGVGLAGVMMIIRPGSADFDLWSVAAIASVLLIVGRDLASRSFSLAVPSSTIAFYAALAVTMSAPLMPSGEGWRVPTADETIALGISIGFLTLGYLTAVATMRVGEVGFVSPFRYSSLVFAILLGLVVFGEWPRPWTWAGAALVVAAGLYSIWRETRVKRGT